MAEIHGGEYITNETNENSQGGTEQLTQKLSQVLNPELLKEFQIISSRVRDLDEDKIRIFWAHDLPGDPESEFLKDKSSHDKFHKFVFVSNWQMQGYMQQYGIPWSKCIVLQNAIEPIPEHTKPDPKEKVNLIYHSTPHRGLNILVPVFEHLYKKYEDKIHLDIFSSFELYGWGDRDAQYKDVFDRIEQHPGMVNHGTVPNEGIREALQEAHIFAYPSIWAETSCLCLMEAMSAGCVAVHSNYAALYETAANWTNMYQLHEDQNKHAGTLYNMLEGTIDHITEMMPKTQSAKSYVDLFYSWTSRKFEWEALLQSLVASVKDRSIPSEKFSYSTDPVL